jgi:Rrf2 family protein
MTGSNDRPQWQDSREQVRRAEVPHSPTGDLEGGPEIHVAALPDPELIREVAECSGVSAPYLAKLVRKLAEAGIVHSKRGYKGGVQLARLPEEITLLELAAAIDGPQDFDRCLIGLEACSDARACPAHAFWKKTREDIRDTLRRTTLAGVIEFEARKMQATKSKPSGEAKALSSRFSLNPARNP